MLRKMLLAFAVTGLAISAAACNTVKGLGDDLKSASKTTEDAINGR